MEQNWSNLRFGEMKVATDVGNYIFEVQVYLNGIDANSVRVELYADGVIGGLPVRQEMKIVGQLVGANGITYSTQVPTTRPAADYTARVIPHWSGVAVPL
jgi:starch phosphorylase